MTPIFRVLADGADITAAIADRLVDLRTTDEAGMTSDTAEIKIDDRDGIIALPRKGAELSIALGYAETGLTEVGLYTVDEVSLSGFPMAITIKGKAADMRGSIKAAKTRPWHATTLGAVVAAIAAEHGLAPKVSPELAARPIAHLDQTNESDLHLLTRLAKDHGAVAKPAGGHLLFVKAGEAKSASGKTLPALAIGRGDIASYSATMADRAYYGAVVARFHDTGAAKEVEIKVGDGAPIYTISRVYPDRDQAAAAARAKKDGLDRGLGELTLGIVGNPQAMAEAELTVTGIRDGVDGDWLIKKVEHTLSNSGFITSIDAETPKK